jgi:hypothetical protein
MSETGRIERNEPVSLRMSKDEVQMLKGLAVLRGLSQSDVIRQLIRDAWAARPVVKRGR